MAWILENLSTIIVLIVVVAILSLIVVKMIKDKKQGKSSCGCNCSSCPMGGSCNSIKKKDE